MKHRAVRRATTVEAMTLHEAGEAAPFRATDDLDEVVFVEDIDENFIADVGAVFARLDAHFAQYTRWRHAGTLEVPFRRLVHLAWRFLFDQAELHRVVTIRIDRLFLHDDAWAGLDHRHRRDRTVVRKNLRHSELLANNSVDHVSSPKSGVW